MVSLCGDDVYRLQKWNGNTSFNSLYTSALTLQSWRRYGKPFYVQISDDTTNRITRFSQDGVSWEQAHSVGNTDFLTPDQYGLGVDPESGGDGHILSCFDIFVE
jgi:hypothetical protein